MDLIGEILAAQSLNDHSIISNLVCPVCQQSGNEHSDHASPELLDMANPKGRSDLRTRDLGAMAMIETPRIPYIGERWEMGDVEKWDIGLRNTAIDNIETNHTRSVIPVIALNCEDQSAEDPVSFTSGPLSFPKIYDTSNDPFLLKSIHTNDGDYDDCSSIANSTGTALDLQINRTIDALPTELHQQWMTHDSSSEASVASTTQSPMRWDTNHALDYVNKLDESLIKNTENLEARNSDLSVELSKHSSQDFLISTPDPEEVRTQRSHTINLGKIGRESGQAKQMCNTGVIRIFKILIILN